MVFIIPKTKLSQDNFLEMIKDKDCTMCCNGIIEDKPCSNKCKECIIYHENIVNFSNVSIERINQEIKNNKKGN